MATEKCDNCGNMEVCKYKHKIKCFESEFVSNKNYLPIWRFKNICQYHTDNTHYVYGSSPIVRENVAKIPFTSGQCDACSKREICAYNSNQPNEELIKISENIESNDLSDFLALYCKHFYPAQKIRK